MSLKVKELKEKRAQLVTEARTMRDTAESEARELTAEENSRWDTIFSDIDKTTAEIDKLERLIKAELEQRATASINTSTAEDIEHERQVPTELGKLHKKALRSFLLGGVSALSAEEVRAVQEVHRILEVREMSAFGAGQSVMLAPQEFTNEIIADLEKKVAVRRIARAMPVNTLAGFGAPTFAEDTEEFDMTPELTAPSAANDISLGKRELRPHQSSKMIKLPIALLQSSAFNIESFAATLLANKFARTEDNMFCNGTGAQQPLGLFTASAFGIDTDRDVVCGSSSNYTWDGMIDCVAALREEYQVGAKFLLPRNSWARLRKLKDGEGRYVWEPSVRVGEPDVILGYGYEFSDFVPSTFTTGLYVGMFGNFDWYWILDFAFTYVQKLVELYALSNQVALVGRRWFDGAPVQPKAFVRLTLG